MGAFRGVIRDGQMIGKTVAHCKILDKIGEGGMGVVYKAEDMIPKDNFPVYSAGYDPRKTHLSIDCHGMMKGARQRPEENYLGPRIGSYGPTWTWDIPLPADHHFVLEYFFYMPSPTANENEDQYLFWWDHEQALATEGGVQYLSPLKKELFLIR